MRPNRSQRLTRPHSARQQEQRGEAHRAGPIVSRTAYHIGGAAVTMYAVDANAAVQNHPEEWSFTPWPVQPAAPADKGS
jgi:hypothetical protein